MTNFKNEFKKNFGEISFILVFSFSLYIFPIEIFNIIAIYLINNCIKHLDVHLFTSGSPTDSNKIEEINIFFLFF